MIPRKPDSAVIVIGAGITGISAAYYLGAKRIPYVVLEAGDDVGGVWKTHRWHGARCDSDFIKYSFSFRPYLSPHCLQGSQEIQRYLRAVAEDFGMREHVRFNTRVMKAVFDPRAKRWTVHTDRGIFTARFLINGNGYFAEPHIPAFRGAEQFKGEILHAARLDGGRTFFGKDVVLVGSGSTAICAAPVLSEVAGSLTLLQRSPSYIYEISNDADAVTRLCQALYRAGFAFPVHALRYYLQCRDDLVFVLFRRFPRFARWFFKRHWIGAVGEAAFRAHFTPRYAPWEQRIAIAIGLKEKLRSGAIRVRTAEIGRFNKSSIVLSNGEELKCDICILATGFDLDLLKFGLYVGETRVVMGERNCYKRLMLGAVPNYFQPLGAWHSAWTQSSERLARFAVEIMEYMERNGFRSVSVARRDVDSHPGITPNYVMRCRAMLPKLHGTCDLPALDNLISFRLDPRTFDFA